MSYFYFAKLFLSMKLLMRSMSNASGPSSTILRKTCSIFGMISSKSWEQLIKGTVCGEGYFLEGLNILISTFCVCANGVQGLSKALHYPILL